MIDKTQIRGESFFADSIRQSENNNDIAKAVVEQYIDNPMVVIDVIGKENTIKCHVHHLDKNYLNGK